MDTDPQQKQLPRNIYIGFNDIPTTELGYAAHEGEEIVVKAALAEGIDWAYEKTHPLSGALIGDKKQFVRPLIEAGSPVTSQLLYDLYSPDFKDLFYQCIARGDTLEQTHLNYLLLDALYKNDTEMIAWSIAHGADINNAYYNRGFAGWTELHQVARACDYEVIKRFIENGADVNRLTQAGETPLYLAGVNNRKISKKERQACIRYLRANGAEYQPTIPWLSRQLLYYFGIGSYTLPTKTRYAE